MPAFILAFVCILIIAFYVNLRIVKGNPHLTGLVTFLLTGAAIVIAYAIFNYLIWRMVGTEGVTAP